nr:retrovirus-related Pol polyprotein from transposon TNT 1-94 [Tanacetum cinerariifolium]
MAMQEEFDQFMRNDVWDLVLVWKSILNLDKDSESIGSTKYRGMIGSLLYLTASRPNIMFSVCLCARFQEDPKENVKGEMGENSKKLKRKFKTIKGYEGDEFKFILRGFVETLGWHLEEIYVTWAHLEKKQTRLRLYTKSFEEIVHTKRGDGLTIVRLIDGSSCGGIDMVIKDLDLELNINAMMRDFWKFCNPSWWKELSKETSSKILLFGDGSC